MQTLKCLADSNAGFKYRHFLFVGANGKAPKIPMLFLVQHELSSCTEPILSGVDIKLKFTRTSDKKLLMTGPKDDSEKLGTKTNSDGTTVSCNVMTFLLSTNFYRCPYRRASPSGSRRQTGRTD